VKLHEIDTPALLLALDAMERNLAKMARFFAAGGFTSIFAFLN